MLEKHVLVRRVSRSCQQTRAHTVNVAIVGRRELFTEGEHRGPAIFGLFRTHPDPVQTVGLLFQAAANAELLQHLTARCQPKTQRGLLTSTLQAVTTSYRNFKHAYRSELVSSVDDFFSKQDLRTLLALREQRDTMRKKLERHARAHAATLLFATASAVLWILGAVVVLSATATQRYARYATQV